jgi:hypothetical protein
LIIDTPRPETAPMASPFSALPLISGKSEVALETFEVIRHFGAPPKYRGKINYPNILTTFYESDIELVLIATAAVYSLDGCRYATLKFRIGPRWFHGNAPACNWRFSS